MRATASGLAVAGFTVAVNEKRKNAEGEYLSLIHILAYPDLDFPNLDNHIVAIP